jgi:hypothetical protein
MYDNKIRLSQDVLEKAKLIAAEWGLKNPRAAVEAVFRKYADDYLVGSRQPSIASWNPPPSRPEPVQFSQCEALNELDDLLGL